MTRATQPKDGIVTNLIACVLAGAVLAIPFTMFALFYFFRRPVSRALQLEERSLRLASWMWLFRALKWLAAAGFAYGAIHTALILSRLVSVAEPEFMHGMLYLAMALFAAGIFNVIHWMEAFYEGPATQKKLAGLQAERLVRELIDAHLRRIAEAESLHGALFVFNHGLPNEFSVEADHILVTQRHIFVIETKYKSGTIAAKATAAHWEVTSPHGQSKMRNALMQAKKAAQILASECALPCMPTPLVAIKGKDVALTDAPTNVVMAEDIAEVIDAFECGTLVPQISPAQVLALLRRHIVADKAALQRHVARADQARARAEMANIVDSASLH